MLEPRDVAEKKLNAETHRLIGEVQLLQYGNFLDKYSADLDNFKDTLANNSNVRLEPILLQSLKTESISLLHLVHSDNKLLSRILASLAAVCEEINLLVEEARGYYSIFVFYGEGKNTTWENLQSASSIVEVLQKIHCFVERCHQVINLLFQQLCAILGREYNTISSGACFPELLDCLAELLVCLLTFDSLFSSHSLLKDHWLLYWRSIKGIVHNPSKYQMTREQVRSLDKHLANIDNTLLTGNIFKNALDKCIDEKIILTIKNSSLSNEISAYISQLLNELEKDEENIFFTQVWLQVNALVVLEHYLFGATDKKLVKRLLEVNKKASACTLCGNILWYPEHFLLKHIPSLSKFIDERTVDNIRLTKIALRSQSLPKESHLLSLQACHWMIEIDRLTQKNLTSFEVKHLQETSNLLIEGIKLVKKISEVVKWITNLHADKGRPMAKSVLLALCRLVEILKCFQFIFHKKLLPLVYIISLISQHLSHKALTLLRHIRKSLTQEKSYKEQQLDVLSALSVCEQNLKGPNTSQRILIAKLSLSASGLSYDHLTEIRSVINRLELICCVHSILNRLCDCSFLYWHQIYMLPVYFSKLIETKADLSRYYLILSALSDCALIAGEKVSASTDTCLKKDLFGPLNQIVETNLRLQTHLHLQLPPSDPFKNTLSLNFSKFSPARMDKYYISIKKETEHYLSTMFYNLTTVVLHDWKTYGEMRRLARLQYSLETVEDNLPMQTLEQGLDVLEIMRNINVFVGKYLYNLNNQVFVEESSNNKHLNTINISHVANSIRTHGIGIMNTTVNFTYQFLQKKFYIFSQFMFDEHIKSRLLKDMRFFSEHKVDLIQMYPYERADKFNIGIRNLGLNETGLSYLDLFRKLITQIGNAMGYVRLIRSGGRRFLADSTCFIPNLKEIDQLNELITQEEPSELTKKAANCFMSDIKNLVENFEEATEYFKLLVKVFIPVFRNPSNIHLKNFYIIVPPLTINFVEHSLTCKERLNKKNKNDAAFTNDGFVIGLAYIIELLGQESQLNSLHWFHSVQAKFEQDKKKIEEQKAVASKQDDKLQQTLQLSEKRINSFEREFRLLYYSFSSARIFFQT
ncbi:hypothetical protein Zmor_003307 [Zophobas morio]|uniref:WASH complex subunit 4 n=1 Tax=Zophobas morio TaxID=2755281 RepID=A0AA38M1E6_9CUCU|nr:hypothetical protein Zmor_003307 [Zophobas morio]